MSAVKTKQNKRPLALYISINWQKRPINLAQIMAPDFAGLGGPRADGCVLY